jgi:hypothetical protein
MPAGRLRLPLLLFLILGFAGCLPSSCSRTESRALVPSDSVSRAIAERLPVDTLRLTWQTTGSADHPLAHPRTVLIGGDGMVYVGDTERNSIFVFSPDSTFSGEITGDSLQYPYLAGFRRDTLVVFNPEARRVDFMAGRAVVHSLPTPGGLPERGALQYVTAGADAVYYKAVAEDYDGFLARLDDRGRVLERTPLPNAYWRHAGFLRTWGDSLLSLCFYRPVADVVRPGGRLDTLAFTGFDSPNLGRSRLFLTGETHEPPMLTISAAPAGDLLFVLNMRPGWIRIDAYDHEGQLRHILTQEDPAFNQDFFPVDLAARILDDGRYAFAVVVTTPTPHLRLYHWQGP